jgi:hypothetical protein
LSDAEDPNLFKSAKALGLTIPPSLAGAGDPIIDEIKSITRGVRRATDDDYRDACAPERGGWT